MVHIIAQQPGPRLRYLLRVLFEYWYPAPYALIPFDQEIDLPGDGPHIYYLDRLPAKAPAGIHIRPSGWLRTGSPPERSPGVVSLNGLPAYPADRSASGTREIPFDLFALLFHQLSRQEEYLAGSRDEHGRFPARASLAHRSGFLRQPLADLWANRLIARLERLCPGWQVSRPAFGVIPTIDIDYPWAFRHKPWWKQAGALLKNGVRHPAIARQQWNTWRGKTEDPFFTFSYLRGKLSDRKTRYFALMGGNSPFDRGPSPTLPAFRELIRGLTPLPGLHPSYAAAEQPALLESEKAALERLLGSPVTHSRQHYLRLRLPQTYRMLLAAGIRHDWTMGYADAVGFRAGTARSFPWYDLEREQPTELIIHPFACMDVSLSNYLELSPQQAVETGRELAAAAEQAGGAFTFIWHNSSFSPAHGWAGWREVFEAFLDLKKLGAQ